MTTDTELQDVLNALLADAIYSTANLVEIEPPEELGYIHSTETFEEAGVLTMNKGLVLRMKDGSEYQVTIVRSR